MTDSYHFQIEPEPRVESTKGTFEVHADGSVSGVGQHGDSFHYTALQIACHSGGLEGYIIGLTYGGYTRRESIPFPSGATLTTSGDKIVGRVEAEAAELSWDDAKSGAIYIVKPEPQIDLGIVQKIRELATAQFNADPSNTDPYMRGLYNGLELALCTLENREPVYRNKPEQHSGGFIVTKGAVEATTTPSPTTDSAYPAIAGLLRVSDGGPANASASLLLKTA